MFIEIGAEEGRQLIGCQRKRGKRFFRIVGIIQKKAAHEEAALLKQVGDSVAPGNPEVPRKRSKEGSFINKGVRFCGMGKEVVADQFATESVFGQKSPGLVNGLGAEVKGGDIPAPAIEREGFPCRTASGDEDSAGLWLGIQPGVKLRGSCFGIPGGELLVE